MMVRCLRKGGRPVLEKQCGPTFIDERNMLFIFIIQMWLGCYTFRAAVTHAWRLRKRRESFAEACVAGWRDFPGARAATLENPISEATILRGGRLRGWKNYFGDLKIGCIRARALHWKYIQIAEDV